MRPTAIMLLLLPGIFLVLAHGRDDRFEAVMIKGFGAMLVIHFVTTAVAKLLLPGPIGPRTFSSGPIGFQFPSLSESKSSDSR